MHLFIWQDNFQLDNILIDDQHQKLFDLANNLARATDRDEVTHHTMVLFNHVREHFSTEEQFMRDHHYPSLQQHIESHDLMLVELVSVSEKIQNNEWQQLDIVEFMHRWVNHILDDDTVFNDYLRQ
jgi:hemerythrin-like metal-binding protein